MSAAPEAAPAPAAHPLPAAPGRITAAPLAPPVHAVTAASGQAAAHPAEGSAEPIRPYRVKTIAVKAAPAQAAAYAPLVSSAPQATIAPTSLAQIQMHAPQPATQVAALPPPPGARPGVLGVLPAHVAAEPAEGATYQIASAYAPAAAPAPRSGAVRGNWIVQIGAFPEEGEARERLRAAQGLARGLLSKADPFTEKVVKGRTELYRARFAVLDEETAEAACKVFKRNEIACFTAKN
jgi:D-alanyl-D-alanine carboxypeptidase